jgi:hypothetical protein
VLQSFAFAMVSEWNPYGLTSLKQTALNGRDPQMHHSLAYCPKHAFFREVCLQVPAQADRMRSALITLNTNLAHLGDALAFLGG